MYGLWQIADGVVALTSQTKRVDDNDDDEACVGR